MIVASKSAIPSLACALLAAGLMSCLGVNDSKSSSKAKATIRLVPVMEPTVDKALGRRAASGAAEDLESFQVAVGAVFLAQNITINGSGWTNPTNTLNLYDVPDLMEPSHSLITGANAMDASMDRYFIDFMTAAGRARLSSSGTFTEQQLGDYNFVVVNWAMPFRVRGSVDLGDGRKIYTKPGAIDTSMYQTNPTSDMMTGPAETAVVVKDNGGTWFRFLRSMTLTETDLTTTLLVRDTSRRDSLGNVIDTLVPAGQLNVMLVYNPDGFLSGWDSAATPGGMGRGASISGPGGVGNIEVPYLDATVVPYRTGEEVWRETYLFTGATPDARPVGFRTRFEIYMVGDNVVAASLRSLAGPAGEMPLYASNIFFVEAGAGGTLNLQDHAHANIIGGFRRESVVGTAGAASLTMGMTTVSACAYTLVEKRRMN
jgi:hypothetical protein